MSKGGRFLKQPEPSGKKDNGARGQVPPQKKKSGVGKIVLIVIAAILALVLCLGIAAYFYVQSMISLIPKAEYGEQILTDEEIEAKYGTFGTDFDGVEEISEETTEETTTETTVPYSDGNYGTTGKVINILLVGQDSREDEKHKNSDTIILCSLNKETKVMTLSSFLRDSYVRLANYKTHTCGMQRINVAYALGYSWGGDLGAMEMLDNTIINNYGAKIDHNVEINLESFITIVDALGGIDAELDADEAGYMTYLNGVHGNAYRDEAYVEGVNHFSGPEALNYARMRHSSNADNDFKRTNRQRNVVAAVLSKVKNLSVSELNSLARDIMPMILTDMTTEEITTYMMEVIPVLPFLSVETQQIPAQGTFSGKMKDIMGVQSGVLEIYDMQTNRDLLTMACEGITQEELDARKAEAKKK